MNTNANTKSDLVLISGRSTPVLSQLISTRLGIPLTPVISKAYPCGELSIELSISVRNRCVYIIQSGYTPNFASTSSALTPNDHLVELIFLAEACIQDSAQSVHLVIPCMPYIVEASESETLPPNNDLQRWLLGVMSGNLDQYRGDDENYLFNRLKQQAALCESKISDPNDPMISQFYFNPLKLVADLLSSTNPRSILTLSLPVPQYQGFFKGPLDDLSIIPVFKNYFRSRNEFPAYVIAACDLSSAKRASKLALALQTSFVFLHNDKSRKSNSEFILAGEDVNGRDVLIFSEIADICTKFNQAANHLLKVQSATTVSLLTSHFIIPDRLELEKLSQFSKIFYTNTVQIVDDELINGNVNDKFEVIDVSEYLAQAISLHHSGGSLKHLQDTFGA